jgi:PAS domain S-box-containing protein
LRDLSSRQAIEQQLRERDEILTMAEQSAGIGVWDIDLATQTVRGTQQFWRVMGLPPTEEALPIETTRRLRLPEDGERVAKGFRAILDNHAESFEMEYRIRRPDGEVRWIFGRGRLVRDVAGQPTRYSGIDIDVTERKSAEAALADLNQALEYRVLERTMALEAEMTRRAEAGGRAVASCSEDGDDRPTERRARPRFQQSSNRHLGQR